MDEEGYMREAIKQAKKAYKNNEIPIGAVIVCENKIISKGYNQKEIKNVSTGHAEIVAIEKACKVKKNWRLSECTIYVTLEPCMMCYGAILESRIKNVVYILKRKDEHKFDIKNSGEMLDNKLKEEYEVILNDFFEKLRNK